MLVKCLVEFIYFTMSVVAFMLFFQRIELKTDCVFLSMEYLDSLLESI